jgi:hypothetical protein
LRPWQRAGFASRNGRQGSFFQELLFVRTLLFLLSEIQTATSGPCHSGISLGPVALLDGLWAQAPAAVVDLDQLALAVRAPVIRGRPFQLSPSLMLFLASV